MQELESTINDMVVKGKGILAADESNKTAAKRLASINVESTEETRRQYREMLFTAPGLGDFISGVILFEETLHQKASDGTPFPEVLKNQGIVPGIKVDKGLIPLEGSEEEKTTQGLKGLEDRIPSFKKLGARFAKWRAVYSISDSTPTALAQRSNAAGLAKYAAICQAKGIIPIVEPEVLIDGDHTIEKCFSVTKGVLLEVFQALAQHHVILEYMILKPSMVISGKSCPNRAEVNQVAKDTVKVLRLSVPETVASINFLSGGQTPEEATAHLNAMNTLNGSLPWNLSFSYARALQGPTLKAWLGKKENIPAAQNTLLKRAKLNSAAAKGKYSQAMEN